MELTTKSHLPTKQIGAKVIYEALKVLQEAEGELPGKEVTEQVAKRLTFTPWETDHLHDKLLLILSKHSVASGWVEHEVKSALAKERKEKRIVLFPIRLDKAIFDSPLAWATEIRHERNIGDFTGWKQHDDYQKALARLLSELNVKTTRRL